jgi:hypothetical protein
MSISAGAKARLLSKPHVVAVWTDRNTGKIVCGVDRKVPAHTLTAEQAVPSVIEGRETDVMAFAKLPTIRPLPGPVSEAKPFVSKRSLTTRKRPCPGGFSVGHNKITAGTNGCWVRDKDGQWVMLSNNHVLANSNEGVQGDTITQPGPYDLDEVTTNPGTWIGRLRDFVKINTEGGGLPGGCSIPGAGRIFGGKKARGVIEQPMPNLVDAAIADPFGGEGAAVDPEIYQIGVPTGMRPPQVGEAVKKSGRTTEFTTDDKIEAVDLAVTVGYGTFQALFAEQILIISEKGEPFSQPGDSGSTIVAQADNNIVGLLFAGGTLEDGRDATIANQIQHVQELLGVGL